MCACKWMKRKKSDEKKDEPMDKMVERNGEIMAFRLKMLEAAKEHFRDTSRQLVEEKNGLLDYMRQTEKDTMDVVSYLKKLDSDKDDEIATLRKELNGIHDDYAKQKMQMVRRYLWVLLACKLKWNRNSFVFFCFFFKRRTISTWNSTNLSCNWSVK